MDPATIRARFQEHGFIVGEPFATALQLVLALEKPLLIEGPAGVGKTESAKTLAEVLGTRLIRLQCYEGLDALTALYEWNYPRQLLHIRLAEARGESADQQESEIFSDRFLLKRPLLEAITQDRSPVLLIDEIDRADEAFEAFLLEVLAEWQVTIPELGTIRARHKPAVILTSNRTRELSDALRRRCLFYWLPYPTLEEEVAILHARVPGVSARLARQVADVMQVLRGLDLQKAPGVAESLDWAMALMSLHRDHLDADALAQTIGCILKVREDHGVLASHREALSAAMDGPSADRGLETDFGLGTVSRPGR
ncbi:MAG: MoxR family ATPase [Vicinamibacterales bacterium]